MSASKPTSTSSARFSQQEAVKDEADDDVRLPPNVLVPKLIRLPSDPNTALSVTYEPSARSTSPLIVFLNGLILPSSSFDRCIALFLRRQIDDHRQSSDRPAVLTWDRYGQGLSERQGEAKTHDAIDVVRTLDELLRTVVIGDDGKDSMHLHERPIIFVGNSIGCALIRLFVDRFHDQYNVLGVLFLDAMMANTDFVSLFPLQDGDSSSPQKEKDRPALLHARKVMQKIFHPSVGNAEGFDRSQLPEQLPLADAPIMPRCPFITVLGHDDCFFAQDTEERLGIPADVVDRYMNRAWDAYNQGLLRLTAKPERARGTIRPQNAGHFIHVSRPDVIADELYLLTTKVAEISLSSPSSSTS